MHRARYREPPLDPHRRRTDGKPRRGIRRRDRRSLHLVQPGGRDHPHVHARRSEPRAPWRASTRARLRRGRGRRARRMSLWLRLHAHAFADAMRRLFAQPLVAASSLLVLAVAIALPVIAAVALRSAGALTAGVETDPHVNVYLT